VPHLDRAMACGQLAPAIVMAPDGSFKGRTTHEISAGSFFLNTSAGRYEDFLMVDLWGLHDECLSDPAGTGGPHHRRRLDGCRGGVQQGDQVSGALQGGPRVFPPSTCAGKIATAAT